MTRSDIHFVCTGNTCRSPMAEGITRFLLVEAGVGDRWTVSSSGLAAFPGDPAALHARNALEEMGIDISGHRSSRTSHYAVEKARYIFAMTRGHRDHLWRLFPESKDRILLLSDILQRARERSGDFSVDSFLRPSEQDIPDPHGLDLGVYRTVAQTILLYSRLLVLFLQAEGPDLEGQVSD